MRSPSGLILFLIASLLFNLNYLHFNDKRTSQNGRSAFAQASGTSNSVINDGVGVPPHTATDYYATDDVHYDDDDDDEISYDDADDHINDNDLHINIIRQHSLQLNGVEVTEKNLFDHLEAHERELIFGKSKEKRPVKFVNIRHATDAADKKPSSVQQQPEEQQQQQKHQRLKRSTERQSGAQPSHKVAVHIRDSDQLLHLSLRQSPKLIDDAFVFIRRYENSTQFEEDSHKLAKKFSQCFYRNEQSALDLCDENNMRGLFHHNNTDFIIHPLPERFGNSTHVIFESKQKRPFGRSLTLEDTESPDITLLNENVQFEPDEKDFNEPSTRRTLVEETSRPTREINKQNESTATNNRLQHEQQQKHHQHDDDYHNQYQHNHHHAVHKPNLEQLHLNLRFKPRYHQNDQTQQQQQFTLRQMHASGNNRLPQSRPQHHQRRQQKQLKQKQHPKHSKHRRQRRYIASGSDHRKVPQVLHIETAIFVDNDLFKHMAKNFPKGTESHLTRFVLAMINGVQWLYQHPSLGRRINFVLKRLEILYKDPIDLRRSSDIHTYLSNFCEWQQTLNPLSDSDAVHYDHAVILTGLDLYGIDDYGKANSQVVGLAPVAGMCIPTSSCTVNEGKHFESVFVVAHEIGHNLGMRHDSNENGCDPSLYIMSKTLGSGKITWSKCSRTYLNIFLDTTQSQCLFDRGQFINNLDHSAEGRLPGERFDANQQCMLKYGKDSVRARTQSLSDICRDLHCQRVTNSWTSHPALEGTDCGDNRWCRSGICVPRPSVAEVYSAAKQISNYTTKLDYDKRSYLSTNKMAHLQQEYAYTKTPSWSEWGEASECASGCLFGPSKRLSEGSTGLKTYVRHCQDFRTRCLGRDRKYEACRDEKCDRVPIITIEQFARTPCEKLQKFDSELTGEGLQIVGDIEESCKVYCRTKTNGTKSRRQTFPDGTTCRSKHYRPQDVSYCIAGRCEKFSCDNSTGNFYRMDPRFCNSRRTDNNDMNTQSNSIYSTSSPTEQRRVFNASQQRYRPAEPNDQQYESNTHRQLGVTRGPVSTARSKYENEVALRSYHGQSHDYPYKRRSESWDKYGYRYNEPHAAPQTQPRSASLIAIAPESEWIVKSGCHSSCMARSKGLQVVKSRRTGENNIQLCTSNIRPCERLLSANEYAKNTCARYKLKVRGLSGHGTQIAASIDEPDRSCRVGCQDEVIKYRYYLVNGKYGHFPLGTKCSTVDERYCVNGKCLEFGKDQIALQQAQISLALFRSRRKRSADVEMNLMRKANETQSYYQYETLNMPREINQAVIDDFVKQLQNFTLNEQQAEDEVSPLSSDHIEFGKPIFVTKDELSEN